MDESEKDDNVEGEIARMRAQAPTWNLAGDQSLLQLLENMHENVISKAKDTNNQIDDLLSQLNDADVYLNNVNNRFMALSNTQFVENRVYDDDVEVLPVEQTQDFKNDTISKETDMDTFKERNDIDMREVDLQATASALATLESYHEHIRIVPDSDTDTDDESATGMSMANSLILRPKNLYERRPLPYIIGSEQWKTKWHVGLGEEDSSSESDAEHQHSAPQPDQFSSSEDVTDDETIRTASEIGEIKNKMTLSLRVKHGKDMELSESENEDMPSDVSEHVNSLRGHSEQEKITTETHIKPQSTATASNFAAELAKRLGAPLPPKSDLGACAPPQSIPKEPKSSAKLYTDKQKGQVVGNIFSDEPPPLDQSNDFDDQMSENWEADILDENDIFADLRGTSKQFENAKTKFSNSGNTTDTYGDLFADILQPEEKKNDTKIESNKSDVTKSNVRNLFDSDSDSGDIFAATPTRSDDLPKNVVKKVVPDHKGGLFDDDSDTGDLFSTETSLKKPFSKLPEVTVDKIQVTSPKSVIMFSDSDNDSPLNVPAIEHDVYESRSTVNKKPKGGVSLFQGNESNIAAAILKHRPRKYSSSESSDSETVARSNRTVIHKPTNVLPQSRPTIPERNIPKVDAEVPKVVADSIFRDTKINEIYDPKQDNYDLFSNASKNIENRDVFAKKSKDNQKDNLFSEESKDIEDNNPFLIGIGDDDIFSKKTKDLEDTFSKKAKEIKEKNLFSNESKHNIVDKSFLNETKVNKLFSKDIGDDNLSSKDNIINETKDNETDIYSGNSKESKPEIKTKPQPEKAKREDANVNKIESNDVQTVRQENKMAEEKNNPVIAKIIQNEFIPRISQLQMNKDVSPNLFSDDESPICKDDFVNIFHSEPPEFEPEQIKTTNSLFDDYDDVDDIFSNNAGFKALPPKGILFGDDDSQEALKRKVAIFDDEPPDFDDGFSSASNIIENETISTTNLKNSSENIKKQNTFTEKSLESSIDSKNSFEQTSVFEPKRVTSTDDLFGTSSKKAEFVKNFDNIFTDSDHMFKNTKTLHVTKTGGSTSGEFSEDKEILFASLSKSFEAEKETILQDDDDDLFQPSPRTNHSPTIDTNKENYVDKKKSEDKLSSGEKSLFDNISKSGSNENTEGNKSEELPPRVVGKLKPSTLKINVNSLRPGAIPKFSNKSIESDTNSNTNQEEIDGRIIKSVSFDESTNPSVLANMSKDRPRIQVKRKPSTRKGRQDALRKSTVDLNFGKESPLLINDSVDSYVYSLPTSPQEVKTIKGDLSSAGFDSNHRKQNVTNTNDILASTKKEANTPNDKSNISSNKPTINDHNFSSYKSDFTSEKQNFSSDKPIMTSDKPIMTSDKPNITTDKVNITSNQPIITGEKLNLSSDKPIMTSDKPNITTDKVNITSNQPIITGEKINLSSDKPIMTSDKPNITTDKVNITSNQPIITGEKLIFSCDKPIIIRNKPYTINEKPEITSNKPIITSDIPNITGNKPTDRKPNDTEEFVNVNTLGLTYKDKIKNISPQIEVVKASKPDDIFSNETSNNIAKTSSNDLFNDLFKSETKVTIDEKIKPPVTNIPKILDSTKESISKTSISKPNLFGETQVSEDELFSSKKSNISTKKTALVFADDFDEEDLFGAKYNPGSTKNLGNNKNEAESQKKDITNKEIERKTEIEDKKKDTMFPDSEGEDWFAVKFEKVKIKAKTEKTEKKMAEDDLFSSVIKKSVFSKETPKSLFADEDDESDMFGDKKKQASSSKSTFQTNEKTQQQNTPKPQSVPSSAEQVFKDPLSSFDND